MEKPTFESPEEKKRKKAEKGSADDLSRFERIQVALRRAMESLLESPKTDTESKRSEKEQPTEKTFRSKMSPEGDGTNERPATTSTPPQSELISANAEIHNPQSSETRSIVDSNEPAGSEEPPSPSTSSESRTTALRERADQIWQQARESVRSFIDRSRTATSDTETVSGTDPEVNDENLSGLTIAELEDKFGKHATDTRPERTTQTNETTNPIVPLYVAFNELRQRRYRKKLERIADEQRRQQRAVNQTKPDIIRRQLESGKLAQSANELQPVSKDKQYESAVQPEVQQSPPRETIEQQTQKVVSQEMETRSASKPEQPEFREGEVRVSYPPVVTPRAEQTQIMTGPAEEKDLRVDESEAEKQRVVLERSQPAVAVKELVERHPAALKREQLRPVPEATKSQLSQEQRTDDSSSSKHVTGSRIPSLSDQAPVLAGRSRQKSSDQARNTSSSQEVIVSTPRWQQVVLVIINLLLIALLVRELVF